MALTYDDYLTDLKHAGDPDADGVVRELLDNGQVNSVNELFREFGAADQDVPSQAPPVLADYLEKTRQFPDWMESQRLDDIAEFFQHHHLAASAIQATAGLVGTYLSPIGAKTLLSTHQLSHQPHRRLSQSTRLFMGMGDADAFTEHSKLVPTCQKVRLVHAAIRELHRRSGEWDTEQDGAPVSQLYTGGAAIVFSIGALDAMERVGVSVTEREADGFYYAWRIIGHFLGIPDAYLPASRTEARNLWDEARDREWARSDEGVLLTRECIDLYESYMPPGLEGSVPAFLRLALSDTYADMMEVPRSSFDLGADALSTGASTLLGSPATQNVAVQPVLDALSTGVERVCREAFTHGQETEPQMSDRIQ